MSAECNLALKELKISFTSKRGTDIMIDSWEDLEVPSASVNQR